MTLGGAAQVAAAYCPNEWTMDPAVCSYNRPTYATASRFLLGFGVLLVFFYLNEHITLSAVYVK